jgi:TolA-binding protein
LLAAGLALGVSADPPPPPTKGADKGGPPRTSPPSDVELVERLLAARRDYQITLEKLRQHYVTVGDNERARWAEEELKQYHMVPKQAYRIDLDVPPPTLQAQYNIPDANELYMKAMKYKGKGGAFSASEYDLNQKRAELLLQQILTTYPQSNKIGDVAYQLGELYEGKPYRQYRRAAVYFERSFQWNPNSQLDSRLRAARIYDRNLSEKAKAIELYREIIQHETDERRVEEARTRLADLSGGR